MGSAHYQIKNVVIVKLQKNMKLNTKINTMRIFVGITWGVIISKVCVDANDLEDAAQNMIKIVVICALSIITLSLILYEGEKE
jgi:hypothetical protein